MGSGGEWGDTKFTNRIQGGRRGPCCGRSCRLPSDRFPARLAIAGLTDFLSGSSSCISSYGAGAGDGRGCEGKCRIAGEGGTLGTPAVSLAFGNPRTPLLCPPVCLMTMPLCGWRVGESGGAPTPTSPTGTGPHSHLRRAPQQWRLVEGDKMCMCTPLLCAPLSPLLYTFIYTHRGRAAPLFDTLHWG